MQAAYAVAAWLQRTELNGSLPPFFCPPLTAEERKRAAIRRLDTRRSLSEVACAPLASHDVRSKSALSSPLKRVPPTPNRASLGILKEERGGF